MRAETELLIGKALKRQWRTLQRRGAMLMRENARVHYGGGESENEVIVFEQLIKGCLFTLCYSAGSTPALGVLDAKLTDHRLN
jgi:hypothetical protein